MRATLVFTGSNSQKNATSNNTAFITRELSSLGFLVDINHANLNNPSVFSSEINRLLSTYPLVIIIGGLGTDFHPNAKEILAHNLGLNLSPHDESVEKLRQIYARKNSQPSNEDIRFVTVPLGSHVITDDNYAIPGFVLNTSSGVVVALPDNDDVFIDMYVKSVFPYLANLKGISVSSETIDVFGLLASQAENALRSEIMAKEALVSVFSNFSGVKYIHISAVNDSGYPAEAGVTELVYKVKNKLASLISNENPLFLPVNIVNLLDKYDLTISVAESISDGSFARSIESVSGENVLITQVNSLLNDVKHEEMNVPKDILKDFPDASEHMAMAMAAGVLENGTADIGMSISGGMISDNRGGFNSTGFVSLATEQGILVKKVDLIGLSMTKEQIMSVMNITALEMLYGFLRGLPNSVHDLFSLKTLRIKDLDKTLEYIRKKEELLNQGEMEAVTKANEDLLPFRSKLPQRVPPFLPKQQHQQQQPFPNTFGSQNMNTNQNNNFTSTFMENQPSFTPANKIPPDFKMGTNDGAIPMEHEDYNRQEPPNPWGQQAGHNQVEQPNPWGQQAGRNQVEQQNPWGQQTNHNQVEQPNPWGQQAGHNQVEQPNPWGQQAGHNQVEQQNPWGQQSGHNQIEQQSPWEQQAGHNQVEQPNPWGQQTNHNQVEQPNPWGQQTGHNQVEQPNPWGQQAGYNSQEQNYWNNGIINNQGQETFGQSSHQNSPLNQDFFDENEKKK